MKLEGLTEFILGPASLHTSQKPHVKDKVPTGGTALERTPHAKGVKGSRCYTVAHSYQNPINVAPPTADSKVAETGNIDGALEIRCRINHVRVPLGDSTS